MFDINKLLSDKYEISYREELPDLLDDLITSGKHKSIQMTLTMRSAKLLVDDLRFALMNRKLDEDNK